MNAVTASVRRFSQDQLFWGDEPAWTGVPSRLDFIKAMGWYNYTFTPQDAHQFFLEYLEGNMETVHALEAVRKAPYYLVPTTVGWIAKLKLKGMGFDDDTQGYFTKRSVEVIGTATAWLAEREKLGSVAAHIKVPANLRARFDAYLDSINKEVVEGNIPFQTWLTYNTPKPTYLNLILQYWVGLETENERLVNIRQCIVANCTARLSSKPAPKQPDKKTKRAKKK